MTEKNTIIIVCGGRTYADRDHVHSTLDIMLPRLHALYHGAANGADTLAAQWAAYRSVPTFGFNANWTLYGKRAGMIRNRVMLDALLTKEKEGFTVGVIAFPGGIGTLGMCGIAENASVCVWRR
jgi:hypothetical protein